ncbi:hypothetical protein D9M71_175990 [compost metagenome]
MTTPAKLPSSWLARLTPPNPPSAVWPKIPQAMPPHTPHNPCSGQTPRTSSIFQRFCAAMKHQTNNIPAMAPVARAPIGCIRSEPAQTATKPASGPLCRKPGSLRPTSKAATVPPTIAINELTATRPLTPCKVCALITLKPNQPTIRIHDPNARNGILEGAKATKRPSR